MSGRRYLFGAALALFVTSVHAGFSDVEYFASFPGEFGFGVAVVDSRDSTANNPAKANMLGGEISGIFGRRKELVTDSEKPVSDEIAEGLRLHFAEKTQRAVAIVRTSPGSSFEKLVFAAKKVELKRILVLDVQQLWVEMANKNNTQVAYQLEASVLDEAGKVIAKTSASEMAHSSNWGTTASDEIVGRAISALISHPDIVKAMTR